jgi:hypothetical protein
MPRKHAIIKKCISCKNSFDNYSNGCKCLDCGDCCRILQVVNVAGYKIPSERFNWVIEYAILLDRDNYLRINLLKYLIGVKCDDAILVKLKFTKNECLSAGYDWIQYEKLLNPMTSIKDRLTGQLNSIMMHCIEYAESMADSKLLEILRPQLKELSQSMTNKIGEYVCKLPHIKKMGLILEHGTSP